ncbi:polysaccharide deacetylase family protein [Clostridioides difficile]|uniref:polysaccharide deacetylase family protein n=1 Tax=Clostridioides difficile TaxID=1496 RepID=UPI001C28A344|nr:polysaccharide deacetylase family protein [Clostridioides difficile]MDN3912432.1 polysaccharide deacetylase family protein [Clostridioides difficile]HBH1634945.1 polysaccharide deacetylase family protein [Clostridioides difficile]HBH1827296.1 polysaccharide deacetylase family protein [Clostridioides difficile]HEK4930891.1 polysaccharide deacetylase family protein [Clostridioides difficile]
MMFKIFNKSLLKLVVVLSIVLTISNFSLSSYASEITSSTDKVLIIYDSKKETAYNRDILNIMRTLLGRFSSDIELLKLSNYDGEINKNYYSHIFTLGINENSYNNDKNTKNLISSLNSYKGTICWLGYGIENLLEHKKYNLDYVGKTNNIVSVNYRGKSYNLDEHYVFNIVESKDTSNKVIGSINDTLNKYPYIINDKNLFYVSKLDLDGVLFYIFCDSLNDIFNIKTFDKGRIFVRIEDVHAFREPKNLVEIADYLSSKNIPFTIALIPAYVNPKNHKVITLSESPEIVKAIKYMQDKGGTVILHGYTHQYKKEDVSGEGYEFWDGKKDEPLKENMKIFVKDRVLNGLRVCIENGIYPLAFEAPHYAMESEGYKELKKYFSTYMGQHQNNDKKFSTNTYPYIIRDTEEFNIFIPENLGYIDPEDKFTFQNIKENLDKLSIVRGFSGGFFFHSYLNIEYLKNTIEYLEKQNIEFMNLRDFNNWVKVDEIQIRNNGDEIIVNYDKDLDEITKGDTRFKSISNISKILIFIVSISVLIFVIIFIYFKRIDKKKFLK